jgi:sigma-B regulation protein RsbU (phosphoserine phosphatase)
VAAEPISSPNPTLRRLKYALVFVCILFSLIVFALSIVAYYIRSKGGYSPESVSITLVRDVLAISIFGSLYVLIRFWDTRDKMRTDLFAIDPVSSLWTALFYAGAILLTFGLSQAFDIKDGYKTVPFNMDGSEEEQFLEQSILTIFRSNFLTFSVGILSVFCLNTLERLLFFKPTKTVKRNFIVMVGMMIFASLSMMSSPANHGLNLFAQLFSMLAGFLALANSFRLSWILYLKRKEKIRAVVLIPFVILFFSLLITEQNQYLKSFSYPVAHFITLTLVFTILYLSTSFFSLLFHLPTSAAFERKAAELTNLYSMSKVITEVFDEAELYKSVTEYAVRSSDAMCAWLEIYRGENASGTFNVVSQHKVDAAGIRNFFLLMPDLHREIATTKKAILVQDVHTDERSSERKRAATFGVAGQAAGRLKFLFQQNQNKKAAISSFVAVPLISRGKLIGALFVAKASEGGFVKDDTELISTFADQAAVAIDNSRLIKESIVKERLQQELLIAQKIQLRLLPQRVPSVKGFEIDGISYPAYEVGGDYYDFVQLGQDPKPECEDERLGIIIGDVSGKGTSAAFYMAEMKGIFQSLSRIYKSSPKDFLVKANEIIHGSSERNVFISMLYAIIDVRGRTISISNAGHCPAAFVSKTDKKYLRVKGLALGLDGGKIFTRATEEQTFALMSGDVLVFYTDGVVEATNAAGDLFGYERLLDVVSSVQDKSATDIKLAIIEAVNHYAESGSVSDDLTLVVIKCL